MAERYNLAISWTWEFDRDFVYLTENTFQANGLSTYLVELHNVEETLRRLRKGDLCFDFYLDRAYDFNIEFLPLVRFVEIRNTSDQQLQGCSESH